MIKGEPDHAASLLVQELATFNFEEAL